MNVSYSDVEDARVEKFDAIANEHRVSAAMFRQMAQAA